MINLFRDTLKVVASNILIILASIASGFFVPKLLSLEQFAVVASFTLYVSFVGILHGGFIDGIHLKYGGYLGWEIPRNELKSEIFFLVISQLAVSSVFALTAFITDKIAFIPVAMSILPINVIAFFLFLFQATRQFSLFSLVNICRPALRFFSVIAMMLFLQLRTPNFFIWSQVGIAWSICLFLLIIFSKNLKYVHSETIFSQENICLLKTGVFIMGGNIFSLLFFSFDRWFVKLFLSVSDFAYYSFAVSMMAIVMLVIRSISLTFYPMLVKNKGNQFLQNQLRDALFIVGAYSCLSFFVLKLVIINWLQKYAPSLGIIGITLASLPAIAVIKGLYENMFKAHKEEKRYFKRVASMAVVSFSLNIIVIIFWKTTAGIAIATTASFFVWLIVGSFDFPGVHFRWEHVFLVTGFILIFYCSAHLIGSPFAGFVFYFSAFTIMLVFFLKESFFWLLKQTLEGIRSCSLPAKQQ